MLDVLSFLANNASNKAVTSDLCTGGVADVVALAKMVIKILQIAVPIGLIVMGTIDMAKAVIAGDEKKMKEAQKPFVKRIIAAVIVFLIPIIVNMILSFVTTGNSEWVDCYNNANWNGAIDVGKNLDNGSGRN